MTSPTPEEWRSWATHPCSKALLRKLFGMHVPKARSWFNITDERELLRAQASFGITSDLIAFVSVSLKKSTRDICTEAGFDPDQLSE